MNQFLPKGRYILLVVHLLSLDDTQSQAPQRDSTPFKNTQFWKCEPCI